MTSIEERIVSLGFNNQNFERHAAQSLSTLDKLDQTLDAIGGAKGVGLLSNALDAISSKFSVLGTIGDQVLRRIADGLFDVGEKFVAMGKSLSVDQITAGWSKYADKTSAVQTIMAATAKDWSDTGAQMEYVSEQLDKLNWFTDETSYSFLDMVNNIGKFTSNGVKLEDAVTSMEGISTWAAISGANVGEASRAMYNLSQAMAVGSVKLMDWKSIENANMATQEFKETALETAVSLGTLTKRVDREGNAIYRTAKGHEFFASQFNTYLSDEWFSKAVLQDTLNKYGEFANVLNQVGDATGMTATEILQGIDAYEETGKVTEELRPYIQWLTADEYELGRRAFKAAQEAKTFAEALDATKDAVSTGWMNTFEKIFGDYEEAKKLWTGLANGLWEVFAAGGELRNEALDLWRQFNGYERLWESLSSIGNNLVELIGDVRYGLLDIFGADIHSDKFDNHMLQILDIFKGITDGVENAAEKFYTFVSSLKQLNVIPKIFESLRNVFQGLQEPVSYLKESLDRTLSILFQMHKGREVKGGWARALALNLNTAATAMRKVTARFRLFMKNEKTGQQFNYIMQSVADTMWTMWTVLQEIFKSMEPISVLGKGLFKVFLKDLSSVARVISGVASGVRYATENFDLFGKISRSVYNILAGLMAPIELFRRVFSEAFGKDLLDGSGVAAKVAESLGYISTKLEELSEKFWNSSQRFTKFLEDEGLLEDSTERISKAFDNVMIVIDKYFNSLDPIMQFAQSIFRIFLKDFNTVLNIVSTVFDGFTLAVDKFDFFGRVARSIQNVLVGLYTPISLLKQAFSELYGDKILNPKYLTQKVAAGFAKIGIILETVTGRFREFMRSSSTIESLSKLARGIVTAFDIVRMVFKSISENLAPVLWETIKKLFSNLIWDLGKIGQFISDLQNKLKETGFLDKLTKTLANIVTFAAKVWNIVRPIIVKIAGFVSKDILKLTEGGAGLFDILGGIVEILGGLIDTVIESNPFQMLGTGVKKAIEWINKAFETLSEGYKETFGNGNSLGTDLYKVVKVLGMAFLGFKTISGLDFGKKKGFFATLLDTLEEVGESVTGALKAITNGVNAKALRDVAISIGILSVSLVLLALIDSDRLATALSVVATGIVALIGTLVVLNRLKIKKGVTTDFLKVAGAIFLMSLAIEAVAVSLLVMSLAIRVLKNMEPKEMITAVAGLVVMLGAVVGLLYLLTKSKGISSAKLLSAGAAILMVAVAIGIIAGALVVLSLVPFDRLKKAVLGLAIALAAIGLVIGLMAKFLNPVKMVAAAASIVLVSLAIAVLAASLLVLAFIPKEDLIKGVLTIAVTLAIMVVAIVALAAVGPMALVAGGALALLGVGMVLAAASLLILAVALRSMNDVVANLPAIAGGLALLGLALIPLGIGGAFAVLGVLGFLALNPLASALNMLAGIKIAAIAGGLALLGLAFIPLGAGAVALGLGALGLAAGALGLIALGLALPILANGLNAMGSVGLSTLLVVAAGIAALGLAGIPLMLGAVGLLVGAPALKKFAQILPELAEGLQSFQSVDWSTIGKAFAILAESIIALMAVDLISLLGDGTPALSNLAATFPQIAEGFQAFSEIDPDTIITVGQAMKTSIKAMFGAGIASIVDGTPAMRSLGEVLPVISSGFRTFEGIDPEWLLNMATSLGKGLDTLMGNFFGNLVKGKPDFASITQLAMVMPSLAVGFHAFDGLDPEALVTMSEAVKQAVNNLMSIGQVEEKGGIAGFLGIGDQDENPYGGMEGVINFLFALATAILSIPDNSGEKLMAVGIGVQTIADATDAVLNVVSEASFSSILSNIEMLSMQIENWMTRVTQYIELCLTNLLANLTKFLEKEKTEITKFMNTAYQIFVTGIAKILHFADLAADAMYTKGENMGKKLAEGIRSQIEVVYEAAQELIAASQGYRLMLENGENLAQGYADGISNGMVAVMGANQSTFGSSGAYVQSTYGIHSPSRVMEKLGGYLTTGFAIGIQNGSGEVESSMITVVNPILAALSALMDEDMNIAPTITPVVDMSNVDAAAGSLGGYFGGNYAFGARTPNVDMTARASGERISARMNETAGTVVNGDNIVINVYPSQGMNEKDLADKVMVRIGELSKRRKVAFG